MKYVLLVTWFYYGQPPATTQMEMSSYVACDTASVIVTGKAAGMELDIRREQAEEAKRGIISNPIIPRVVASCITQ